MLNANPKIITSLEQQIDAGRQKLQDLWEDRGFTDAEVLAAGIELDDLLNEYQKLKSQTKSWPNNNPYPSS